MSSDGSIKTYGVDFLSVPLIGVIGAAIYALLLLLSRTAIVLGFYPFLLACLPCMLIANLLLRQARKRSQRGRLSPARLMLLGAASFTACVLLLAVPAVSLLSNIAGVRTQGEMSYIIVLVGLAGVLPAAISGAAMGWLVRQRSDVRRGLMG